MLENPPVCGRLPQEIGYFASTSDHRKVRFCCVGQRLYIKSGREDLNLRPHGPEKCCLCRFPRKNKHFVNRSSHFPSLGFTEWFTECYPGFDRTCTDRTWKTVGDSFQGLQNAVEISNDLGTRNETMAQEVPR